MQRPDLVIPIRTICSGRSPAGDCVPLPHWVLALKQTLADLWNTVPRCESWSCGDRSPMEYTWLHVWVHQDAQNLLHNEPVHATFQLPSDPRNHDLEEGTIILRNADGSTDRQQSRYFSVQCKG